MRQVVTNKYRSEKRGPRVEESKKSSLAQAQV